MQEEEQEETRTETEQPTEETRKRNRGAEETKTEQRKENQVMILSQSVRILLGRKNCSTKISLAKGGSAS